MTPVKLTCEIDLEPGEKLQLPPSVAASIGPGHWLITVERLDQQGPSAPLRDHSAFLSSYAPEDEGLHDERREALERLLSLQLPVADWDQMEQEIIRGAVE